MREEDGIHVLPANPLLCQALKRTAAGIEQQLVSSRLYQNARAESGHDGRRAACPEQSHLYCFGRGTRMKDNPQQ